MEAYVVKTQFSLADIVWIMHNNKAKQTFVAKVNAEIEQNFPAQTLSDSDVKNILTKGSKYLEKQEKKIKILYDLCEIENFNLIQGVIEEKLFESKEDLLRSL